MGWPFQKIQKRRRVRPRRPNRGQRPRLNRAVLAPTKGIHRVSFELDCWFLSKGSKLKKKVFSEYLQNIELLYIVIKKIGVKQVN